MILVSNRLFTGDIFDIEIPISKTALQLIFLITTKTNYCVPTDPVMLDLN